MTGCRFFRLTVKGRTSVCLLRTPVSVNRWWSSPHVHQSWSPGPRYSFWSWLWSHSLQLFLFPTQEKGFHWWSRTTVLAFFHQQEELHVLLEYLEFLQSPVNQPYKPLQPFWPLFQRSRTPSATDRPFLVIFLTSVRRAAERKRNGFWVFFFLVKILQWINRKSKEQWHVIYQRLEEDHEHQERMWTHVLRHSAAAAETQPQLHSLWLQLLRNSGCYLRWTWRVCI